ncbi:MAG: manganese efflux pump MntP family protein [Clostridiales bacterium]|nr:manganese efflux pump MntP family protein [Clostridiales bacterium]
MNLQELFFVAVGLSMDALAISLCKGLSVGKVQKKHMIITGLWFGGSQAIMPLIGYLLGINFQSFVESIDHWITFILLGMIGLNMIRESREEAKKLNASFSAKVMFPLAIADSIDALAAGVTFAFMDVNIIPAVLLIGTITCVLSALGVKLGSKFGEKYKSKAEILGGIILITMGTLTLLQDLGVL